MSKRILVIAAVLLIAVSVAGFSQTFGIGGAFSLDAVGGLPSGAMLSLKVPAFPVVWGLGLQLGNNQFNLGLTADWWLFTTNLVSFINLYVGPGLYLALPQPFEIGGRVPIGLNAYPLDVLELFLEFAPTLVFVSNRGIAIPSFSLQGAFGFRFWFNT